MTIKLVKAAALAGLAAILIPPGAGAAPAPPPPPPAAAAPIVFFDIVAPDLAKETAFYQAVFGWKVGADGHVSVGVAAPLSGVFRIEQEEVGPERVLYLGVPDIAASLAAVKAHGGTVIFPRLAVPGVAYIALFKDPAGNRTGLVEIANGQLSVPPAK